MKKFITAPVLAELAILATFTADCLPDMETLRHNLKYTRNKANKARIDIIARIKIGLDSDEELYENADYFFDKYYYRFHNKSDIIYICIDVLERVYMSNYYFEDAHGQSFGNLFKSLIKNSKTFSSKHVELTENEKIEFMNDLHKITRVEI